MNRQEQKNELCEMVDKLISLGEDKDELSFWIEIFDTLDSDARNKLLDNLKKEVADLEKLK
jgi:hypothetical protein